MSIFDAADTGQDSPLAGFGSTVFTAAQEALMHDMGEATRDRTLSGTPRHVRRARGKAQRRARKIQQAKARARR